MIPNIFHRNSGAPTGGTLWLVALLWSLPCIAFLIDAPDGVRVKAGITVFALSTVLAAFDRKSVVPGIPFAAMLAPISGTQPFGVEGLLLSDAFLIMAFCAFLAGAMNNNFTIQIGNDHIYLLVGFGLCLFSWAAAIDSKLALNGVLNIAAMGALYVITASMVTSEELGKRVIWSWVIAACYGALLTVVAYTKATPLLLGLESSAGQQYAIDMVSSGMFYRATYFYAGFIFVIGTAGVVFLEHALRGKGILLKLASGFGLLIAIGVLFLMNTKSALAGFVILAIVETVRLLSVGKITTRISRIAALAVALFVASLGAVYGSLVLVEEHQWESAMERMGNLESFEVRLQIFQEALKQLLSNPKMFLVGIGPDLTVRMANSGHATIETLLTNPASGVVEGAIDSTYLTVLVEYGVPFGLLLFVFVIKTVAVLHNAVPNTHGADLMQNSLLAIIVWWMVVALGQTVGTSKPTWLIVQILATVYGVYSVGKKSSDSASMRQT